MPQIGAPATSTIEAFESKNELSNIEIDPTAMN